MKPVKRGPCPEDVARDVDRRNRVVRSAQARTYWADALGDPDLWRVLHAQAGAELRRVPHGSPAYSVLVRLVNVSVDLLALTGEALAPPSMEDAGVAS